MFRNGLILCVIALVLLVSGACSSGPEEAPVVSTSQTITAEDSAAAEAAREEELQRLKEEERVGREDDRKREEFMERTVAHPCNLWDTERRIHKPLTTENLQSLLDEVRTCDPTRDLFDISGRLHGSDNGWNIHPSRAALMNLQGVTYPFRDLGRAFEDLPILEQRAVIETVGPVVAAYVVDYVNSEHLDTWLASLDWERDIAWVDPKWYLQVDWPEDRTESIIMPSTERELSKIGLWVRA